jgi:hypothetical protein
MIHLNVKFSKMKMKHIYECTKIWEIKGNFEDNIPEYEKIMTGNVKEKLQVARIFKDNLKINEKFKKNK